MTAERDMSEFLVNSENFDFYDISEDSSYDRDNWNCDLVKRYNAYIDDEQVYADIDQEISLDSRENGNLKNGDIIIYRSNKIKVILYSGENDFVALDYKLYEIIDKCELNEDSYPWESGENIITIIRPKTEKAKKTLLYYYKEDTNDFESVFRDCWISFCEDAEGKERGCCDSFAKYLKTCLNFPILSDEELDVCANEYEKQANLKEICNSFVSRNWKVLQKVRHNGFCLDVLVYNREDRPSYLIVSKSKDMANIENTFKNIHILIYDKGILYDKSTKCEFSLYEIPECKPETTKEDLKKVIKEKESALEKEKKEKELLKEHNETLKEHNETLKQLISKIKKQHDVDKVVKDSSDLIQKNVKTSSLFDENTVSTELKQVFGDDFWEKISPESKIFLITSKFLYDQYKNANPEKFDTSIICFPALRAIEKEAVKIFCNNLAMFLAKKKSSFENWPTFLIDSEPTNEGTKIFPLYKIEDWDKQSDYQGKKKFTCGCVQYCLGFVNPQEREEESI